MKKLYFIFFLVCVVSINCFASKPSNVWSHIWGSSDYDCAKGISVNSAGNIYIAGYTEGSFDGQSNNGGSDFCLTKYNNDKTKQWTRIWGSASEDKGYGISVDSTDNIYVAGSTSGSFDGQSNNGSIDICLTKYNNNGTKQWTRIWGSSDYDYARGVNVDNVGNVYVAGSTYGSFDGQSNNCSSDIFLTKYNSSGTKQWSRIWGSDTNDFGRGVSVDNSGNAYVVGYTRGSFDGQNNNGGPDIFLTKYNSSGTKQWTRIWGSSRSDYGNSVSVDNAENVYVAGSARGSFDGQIQLNNYDLFLTKYNSSGIKQWTRIWGSYNIDSAKGVIVNNAGYIYVAGDTYGSFDSQSNNGCSDLCLTKYNSSGSNLWTQIWGGSDCDYGNGVSVDIAGNAYIVGNTSGSFEGQTNNGSYDLCLSKIAKTPPKKPLNQSPTNGAIEILLTPTLYSSSFSNETGYSHSASQWQISDNSSFTSTIYDSGETSANKTNLTIEAEILNYSTKYYWRVKYKDNYADWSEYSEATYFKTFTSTNCYVSLLGNHVQPFMSWKNAATNIQAIINIFPANDLIIWISNATYYLPHQINVSNKTVKSLNGSQKTIFIGPTNSNRCFNLYSSIIDGLFISEGGGVYCDNSIIKNSIICSNRANDGGGIFCNINCLVENCSIYRNTAHDYADAYFCINRGGGIFCNSNCVVKNCNIYENTADEYGGGINCKSNCLIENCSIFNNTTLYTGAGINCNYNNIVKNSTISSNTLEYGNGSGIMCLNNNLLENNIICYNTTLNHESAKGGGLYFGSNNYVKSCLIYRNISKSYGGALFCGAADNKIYNSTICDNSTMKNRDGGLYFGNLSNNNIIQNNILWNNMGNEINNQGNSLLNRNNCIKDWATLTDGIITNDPNFRKVGIGNYRLKKLSHCRNSGANISWMSSSIDLDGNPRVADGFVDIGAYENVYPNKPYNQIPVNGTEVTKTPLLQSSIFSVSNYNILHKASQWQISNNSSFSNIVYDSGETIANKTSLTVPSGKLEEATYYYWHVKHKDNHEGWSDYSDETSFETVPEPFLIFHFCLLLIAAYLRKQ